MCLLTTLYLHLRSILFIWASLIGLLVLLAFVYVVYMFWALLLIRNSSTQKIKFVLLSELSPYFIISVTVHKILVFCISFFSILFISWARRILFRKSFLYLYFKICPLYFEVQSKSILSQVRREKSQLVNNQVKGDI